MTTKIITLGLTLLNFGYQTFGQSTLKSNVHIGFVYPLSTNGIHAPEYTNAASFHTLAGVSRMETAFCASGFAGIVKDSVTGFIGSGFASIVGKYTHGTQLAGFLNYTGNGIKGFAGAGFINVAGSLEGAAVAGFGNIVTHDVKGAQVAGFINESQNVNTQVAGFVNIANDVECAQVAGFVNMAKKVKGAQVAGLINIADSSDCPIGIVNIIRSGEKAVGVAVDETGTTLATFRSGGRCTYGIIGVGFNPSFDAAYALQAGLGGHIPVTRNFRINVEGSTTWLYDFGRHSDLRAGLCAMPAIRFGVVEVFAGLSFNYMTSKDAQGIGKTGYSVWNERTHCREHDLSIGVEGGVQFHLGSKRK